MNHDPTPTPESPSERPWSALIKVALLLIIPTLLILAVKILLPP